MPVSLIRFIYNVPSKNILQFITKMEFRRAASPFSRTSTAKGSPAPNLSLEFVDLDRSNEMYKQKIKTRSSRSFSPYMGAVAIMSPEISPIEMKQKPREYALSPKTPKNQNMSLKLDDRNLKRNKIMKKDIDQKNRRKTMFLEIPSTRPLFQEPSLQLEKRICIYRFLTENGFGKYITIFEKEEIDFQVFLTLDEKDLLDIGITKKQDVAWFLTTINELNTSTASE